VFKRSKRKNNGDQEPSFLEWLLVNFANVIVGTLVIAYLSPILAFVCLYDVYQGKKMWEYSGIFSAVFLGLSFVSVGLWYVTYFIITGHII